MGLWGVYDTKIHSPESGAWARRLGVLEVESRGGVVASTLGETFPLRDTPEVLSIAHTSLKSKEAGVR